MQHNETKREDAQDTIARFINDFLWKKMTSAQAIVRLTALGMTESDASTVMKHLTTFVDAARESTSYENSSVPGNSGNITYTPTLNWTNIRSSLSILQQLPQEFRRALINNPSVYNGELKTILKLAYDKASSSTLATLLQSNSDYHELCAALIACGYSRTSSSEEEQYRDFTFMLQYMNDKSKWGADEQQAMANRCQQVWLDEPDEFWATLLTYFQTQNSELYACFLVNDNTRYKQQALGYVQEHLINPLALIVLGFMGAENIPSFKDTTMLKIHQLYWFYYDQANFFSTAPNAAQLSGAIATLAHEQTGKEGSWLTRPDANAQKWQHFQANALTLFTQKPSGTASAHLKNFFDHAAMEAELVTWKNLALKQLNKRIGVYSEEKHDDEQADRIKDALLSLRTLFTELPSAPEANFELVPHMKKIQASLNGCIALVEATEFVSARKKNKLLRDLNQTKQTCNNLLQRLEGEQQLTAQSDSNQRRMLP